MKKKKVVVKPKISEFGSHSVMVIDTYNQFGEVYPEFLDGTVLCRDEHGTYLTHESRLDDGMADLNRFDRAFNS